MTRGTFAKMGKTIILLVVLSACAVRSKTVNDSSTTSRMTATSEANPTPIATVDYTNQSESDLTALIVERASQLDAAIQSMIAAAMDNTLGNGLTDDIKSKLQDLVQAVQSAQSEFKRAIQVYNNRFNTLSPEASNQIMGIEDEVNSAVTSIAVFNANLNAGTKIDLDALDRLDEVWTTTELEQKISAWQDMVLIQIDRRETYYMNIQPQSSQVADNRVEAFIQAHDFVQAFQGALEDSIFTPDELVQISQIGANAEASLFNTGDPQLFGYAQSIDDLTRNAVRGEWPLASSGIDDLRLSLPARPRS